MLVLIKSFFYRIETATRIYRVYKAWEKYSKIDKKGEEHGYGIL